MPDIDIFAQGQPTISLSQAKQEATTYDIVAHCLRYGGMERSRKRPCVNEMGGVV